MEYVVRVAGSFKCFVVVFGKAVIVMMPEVSELNARGLGAEITQGKNNPDQDFTAHLKFLAYEKDPFDPCGHKKFFLPVDYNECSCVTSEADPDH